MDVIANEAVENGKHNEYLYLYISHFYDRKSPYNPNDPIDEPHFAKYLVQYDIDCYDEFLNKLMSRDAYETMFSVAKAFSSTKKL